MTFRISIALVQRSEILTVAMANINEVLDRQVDPMGHINPAVCLRCTAALPKLSLTDLQVAPLTEKTNVFNTSTVPNQNGDRSSGSEKDFENEKSMYVGELEESEMRDEDTIADPFEPFNDLPEERKIIVTIRAMLVGCVCGALVNASNVYLGLKTGWTFGANLFGAIIGFAVLKPLGRKLPERFPIFGGEFGPRENNIVQTAATAAGGLSSVFVSGIPALYQLGLLSTPQEDFTRLITLTIVGGMSAPLSPVSSIS